MENKKLRMLVSNIALSTLLFSILFLSTKNTSWATQLRNLEEAARKIVFSEGFESGGRMMVMYTNSQYKVNFVGISAERAATGRHSFKVDVTWVGGTSIDWASVPLLIPIYGNPVVRGKLYVEHGAVRFGHAISVPESGARGSVVSGVKVAELHDGWTQWRSTSLGTPGDAAYIQAITVFTGPPDDEGRTVFYVDDLEIDAVLPEQYETELEVQIERIKVKREEPLRKRIRAIGTQFAELSTQIDKVQIAFPAGASEEMRVNWQRLRNYRDNTRSQLEDQLSALKSKHNFSGVSVAEHLLTSLEQAHASHKSLATYATAYPTFPYIVWKLDPTSNEKVLPRKFPLPGIVGTELSISACPGEYEPASFAIQAIRELRNITVECSDAISDTHTLAASHIDIRIVKCWWQAGVGIADVKNPTLTPELLLKDSNFLLVDREGKRNKLRNAQSPADANELKPVSIPAGETQQFWITVLPSEEMTPGTYTSQITLTPQNAPQIVISLMIEVLPFKLESPILHYSIYYRGRLKEDLIGSIGSKWKSPQQYMAEMHNLKAHGITHPTCHQDFGDTQLLDYAIELRKQAGIGVDPFYALGLQTGAHTSVEELETLKNRIHMGIVQVKRHGIKELYIYGVDEASGEALKKERASFKTVQEAGGKVFAACWSGAFELVGDLLHLAIYNGPLIPREARKWQGAEHKLFSYGNPQVGVEQPETYRRNYGLRLWKAGYNGAMNYAYQHEFGNIYVDDDHKLFRDHVFAYPTVNGVIDTIQWEGFREGVDDVRYLTTLLKAIENAKAKGNGTSLAKEAENWVETLNPNGNLQALRADIVKWILQFDK